MDRIKSLLKTQLVRATFSLLLTTGLTSIVGFVFWQIVTKYSGYSASDVGQATTLMAIVSTASILSISGINPAIVLALSSRKDEVEYKRTVHGHAIIAATVSGLITLVGETVLVLSSPEYGFLQDPAVFIVGVLTGALAAGGATVDATSMALHKSGLVPLRNTGQSILKLGLIIPFVMLGMSAPVSATLTALIGGWILTEIVIYKISGRFFFKKDDIKYAWKLINKNLGHHQIASLGATLPPVITPLIVTAMIGTAESAIFSIVWMIGALFFTISPSVSNAILSSTANRNDINLAQRIKQSSVIIFLLMIIPLILVIIFPEQILSIFGEAYQAGGMLLLVLSLSALPDAVTNISVAYLRLKGDLKPASILNVGMGVITIALVIILTPSLNIVAPGWAWLVAQSLGSIGILIYIFLRYIKKSKVKAE